jgi:hypothetical protein
LVSTVSAVDTDIAYFIVIGVKEKTNTVASLRRRFVSGIGQFAAYTQFRSNFLKTRMITAKVPPTTTVNRYASQNIHLSFASCDASTASPMSAQPKSAHKQEDAGQDPATDATPE